MCVCTGIYIIGKKTTFLNVAILESLIYNSDPGVAWYWILSTWYQQTGLVWHKATDVEYSVRPKPRKIVIVSETSLIIIVPL